MIDERETSRSTLNQTFQSVLARDTAATRFEKIYILTYYEEKIKLKLTKWFGCYCSFVSSWGYNCRRNNKITATWSGLGL